MTISLWYNSSVFNTGSVLTNTLLSDNAGTLILLAISGDSFKIVYKDGASA